MNIAQIGFQADTSGLDNAAASLQKLVPASAAAETAADNVTTALQGTSAAATAVANAAKGTTTQTTATAKVISAATGSINQQSTANKSSTTAANAAAAATNNLAHSHAGLSTQAMSAQHSIRSMVEGLASGMPVSTVLTQQLNHLSYAASGPGGLSQAFSDAIGMFTKLISVSTLVIGGIAAMIIGFAALAISAIKSEAALGDLSKATNFTINDLRGLQEAANLKGVAPADFQTAITAISKGVLDATHNMGGLNDLFLANGIQVKGNVASLKAVADLVAQTSDGVQKRNILEAAGLPTTTAFVKMMNQGGTAIQAIIDGTSKFNTAAENNLIKKAQDFEDAWNKVTTNVSTFFHNLFVSAVLGINSLQQNIITFAAVAGAAIAIALAPFSLIAASVAALIAGAAALARIGGLGQANTSQVSPKRVDVALANNAPTTAAASGATPQTHDQAVKANSDAQARISILGDLATVTQQTTSKQLELNAANLNGVGPTSTMAAKILLNTKAQAEQNLVNQQATAGIFNLQTAQQSATDTLQNWINHGYVDASNAQQMAAAHLVLTRNIQATADAAAVAAAPLQQLKQLELDGANLAKNLDTAATSALNNLVQPIQDMMNGVTGLSAGFQNLGVVVLQAIQQMIIKMLILTPIAKGLQSVFGGLFGFSAGGIPGASGPTSLGGAPLVPNALGGVYSGPNISSFSGQIVSKPTLFKFASGAGLMGEAGSEAIMPLTRGPGGSLGIQMYGQQAGNDNSTMHVTYAPQYTLGGNVTQDDLANVKKQAANDRAQFTANTAKSIQELRKRNVRV